MEQYRDVLLFSVVGALIVWAAWIALGWFIAKVGLMVFVWGNAVVLIAVLTVWAVQNRTRDVMVSASGPSPAIVAPPEVQPSVGDEIAPPTPLPNLLDAAFGMATAVPAVSVSPSGPPCSPDDPEPG